MKRPALQARKRQGLSCLGCSQQPYLLARGIDFGPSLQKGLILSQRWLCSPACHTSRFDGHSRSPGCVRGLRNTYRVYSGLAAKCAC